MPRLAMVAPALLGLCAFLTPACAADRIECANDTFVEATSLANLSANAPSSLVGPVPAVRQRQLWRWLNARDEVQLDLGWQAEHEPVHRAKINAMKYLHTMVRVANVEASLRFYRDALGLEVLSRQDNEAGKSTLIFL